MSLVPRVMLPGALAVVASVAWGRVSAVMAAVQQPPTELPSFKQWGGRTSKAGGNELEGRQWMGYPLPKRRLTRQIREMTGEAFRDEGGSLFA